MSKPIVGYWDIRGLAEPIRTMLNYAGAEFEDKRYTCGDAPTYDISGWRDEKYKLGLDFPNLPYYIDGDTKLTESWAILKHVARIHNLMPEKDPHLCDMVEGLIADFRGSFIKACYSPEFEKLSSKFFDDLPSKLDKFEAFLSKHDWIAGDKLTYVDFAFCEFLSHIELCRPSCLDKHEKVKAYFEKFFMLEKISAYRASENFKKYPVNNKMASWGGKAQ